MNTNSLKKFAQEARKKLIAQVTSRLSYVLMADSLEHRTKAVQIDKLKTAIKNSSEKQIIDQVAYTWFNRFMALRFMDVNDYQPLGIRIVSPREGFTVPEILQEAKQGILPVEFTENETKLINSQLVFDLLNGNIPSNNAQNEAFKELLVAACNHLSEVFPFLFERIEDFSELLLPDDLTSPISILQDFRQGMSEEDCSQVEVIGWLYQFYISERKDEVFASKKAVPKEDIPAATQLFTPRWIVEYMVQNTIGKLWLQNKPNSRLREHMPYFIESASVVPDSYLIVKSVEDLTLLDQACGSGHILVYGFELLFKIYEEEGYNITEIPQLIIEKNLFGFEIDPRAAQLAGFALMMKARSYHRRFFRKQIKPNILCYKDLPFKAHNNLGYVETFEIQQDSPKLDRLLAYRYCIAQHIVDEYQVEKKNKKTGKLELVDVIDTKLRKGQNTAPEHKYDIQNHPKSTILFYKDKIRDIFSDLDLPLSDALYQDLVYMTQATNLGSLISPRSKTADLIEIAEKVKALLTIVSMYAFELKYIAEAVELLIFLSKKYLCIVDNPPYMGGGNMNSDLAEFVKKYYPDSKADLMACFMEAGLKALHPMGFLGMINQHSWMFLSSYEALRKKLISNTFFDTNLHLGARTFPEIGGEVVQNASFTFWNTQYGKKGNYLRLVDLNDTEQKRQKVVEVITSDNHELHFSANQKDFEKIPGSPIGYWLSENSFLHFKLSEKIRKKFESGGRIKTHGNEQYLRMFWEVTSNKYGKARKWEFVENGGEKRKWFGNIQYVIDWSKNALNHYNSYGGLSNKKFWDKGGISWAVISSTGASFRIKEKTVEFTSASPTLFSVSDSYIHYTLAFLNSKYCHELLKVLNPTINTTSGDVISLPLILNDIKFELIDEITKDTINFSKLEWGSRETSCDFLKSELIRFKSQDLEETYDLYQAYWQKKFFEIHKNEEELNRQFIEIYSLQDELTPDVPLEDITILKEETNIINGELVFNTSEVFAQFMSYAVGCMFGRYSLDKEGLILANQGETLEDYLQNVYEGREISTDAFMPDEDNIIPILDDEWFEDDIVGRFYAFLKTSFGTQNFDKNLSFIEDCLGKDIRKYFVKDFYADHIKRYKKRPIYWIFSSPKGSFNVLIYMHRYTSDTLNQILNGYLVEFRAKLNNQVEQLDHIIVTGNSSEQNKASKEKDRVKLVLIELKEYERNILYPLATERITIDLDDGVLVNYNKFGKAIKEVSGLNDSKTKAKVKQFDWIDKTQII